ncbi:MAG: hypothetical protein WA364_16610 [Candidatus Nitrosopolaris sp.]
MTNQCRTLHHLTSPHPIESEIFKPEPVTSGSINKTTVKSNRIKFIRSRFKWWAHPAYVCILNTDGSDRKIIVTACRHPNGILVNVEAGTFSAKLNLLIIYI